MSRIIRIKGNKIEFKRWEEHIGTVKGLILKHFQRRPVDAQIYIVAVGNNIFQIHEKLSHGVTIKTSITEISSQIDLPTYYEILQMNFDYYLVDGATA